MFDDLTREFDALEMYRAATRRHQIHFSVLIAETSLWASPKVHQLLLEENGTGAWFPNVRRYRPGQGEQARQTVDGVRLDDNSYANQALKRALGIPREKLSGFEVCHIWPGTCYDPAYHTCIANLTLLPRPFSALTDHDPEIQAALKYRAYELYSWKPAEEEAPGKPEFWPTTWLPPLPFTYRVQDAIGNRRRQKQSLNAAGLGKRERAPAQCRQTGHFRRLPAAAGTNSSARMDEDEIEFVLRRIERWAANPKSNVHKILAIVVEHEQNGGIRRDELITKVGFITGSRNPNSAVAQLLTSRGHAYGQALTAAGDAIRIHPQVREAVLRHTWSK